METRGQTGRKAAKWVVVPALLAAAAVGSACGSSEVTEEDYRSATGEICSKYEKVIEADQKQVSRFAAQGGTNPGPFVKVIRKFQRDWDQFAAELKAVERPPADREEIDRFFAALTASQDRIAELAAAVEQLPGLLDEVEAVQQSQDPAQAEALAERASRIQNDVRKTEAGFEASIDRVEQVTRSYPGLADCR